MSMLVIMDLVLEISSEDEKNPGTFLSLPYEVAHAVVRTLCLHTHSYLKAKDAYLALKNDDPGMKKLKTRKSLEEMQKLEKCNRFCVLNRRTGFVATADWLSKHIKTNASGMPELKKPDSKCNPWILTLQVAISGPNVSLALKSDPKKAFRAVKCFDIRHGSERTLLSALTTGYEHLFESVDEDRLFAKMGRTTNY